MALLLIDSDEDAVKMLVLRTLLNCKKRLVCSSFFELPIVGRSLNYLLNIFGPFLSGAASTCGGAEAQKTLVYRSDETIIRSVSDLRYVENYYQ